MKICVFEKNGEKQKSIVKIPKATGRVQFHVCLFYILYNVYPVPAVLAVANAVEKNISLGNFYLNFQSRTTHLLNQFISNFRL